MKRFFGLVMACVMALSLVACGEEPSRGATSTPVMDEPSATTSTWKEFLTEYDACVDRYIEMTQKYQKNPTDPTLLADYTKMAEEAGEWATRAQKLENELKGASASELAEYTAQLKPIVENLAKVVQ